MLFSTDIPQMDPVSRAQNTENSAITATKKIVGRPFKKGISGNPGGRPKKLHVTRIYEQVLASPGNRKDIKASIMETLNDKGMAKVLLLREMAERTEGKVIQEFTGDISITLGLADSVADRRKRIDADD